MNPRALGHALTAGELEQRSQMVYVRVDTTLRHEAEQVDVASALGASTKDRREHLVLEERAVLDRPAHAYEILEENAACADGQVSNLGVPHLPRGQADRPTRCLECRVRVPRPQLVEYGCVRELDCVARPRWGEPPPVEDDQHTEREGHAAAWAAARQIAWKLVASSEAPPTSTPSTSGWVRTTECSRASPSRRTEPLLRGET